MSKEQIDNETLKSDVRFIKDFLQEECGKIVKKSIMWYAFNDLEQALEDLEFYKKMLEIVKRALGEELYEMYLNQVRKELNDNNKK